VPLGSQFTAGGCSLFAQRRATFPHTATPAPTKWRADPQDCAGIDAKAGGDRRGLSFLARSGIADGRISALSHRRIDALHDDILRQCK
jgi:hypothetical protein